MSISLAPGAIPQDESTGHLVCPLIHAPTCDGCKDCLRWEDKGVRSRECEAYCFAGASPD